ncbi:MAG TPA: hypothetical protein VE032_06375 [Actinomycetota bacterium]|nr:hypothetical protein [Actinomycetota bacterium]
MLAALLPEIDGWLPAIFLFCLAGLTLLVGVFAVFLIVQQFRNPGGR